MREYTYRVERTCAHRAVNHIRDVGFVVIKSAVPTTPLAQLRQRMDWDTQELLCYCDSIGGNPRAKGHLQQGPPPTRDYVFKEIVFNRYVIDVCTALLGEGLTLTFYNGNTNCPDSTTQHVHMDGAHRSNEPHPVEKTFSIVVNIPLGPMNQENGAIQLWPGTHMIRSSNGERGIDRHQLQARERECPPVQPCTEPGDVLIRDIRLWHRGVPNHSDRPRHMIALILVDQSETVRGKLRFQKGCETELEGQRVDPNAVYVDDPSDYLLGPTRRIYEAAKQQ